MVGGCYRLAICRQWKIIILRCEKTCAMVWIFVTLKFKSWDQTCSVMVLQGGSLGRWLGHVELHRWDQVSLIKMPEDSSSPTFVQVEDTANMPSHESEMTLTISSLAGYWSWTSQLPEPRKDGCYKSLSLRHLLGSQTGLSNGKKEHQGHVVTLAAEL